jgi:hypothetical protein
MTKSAALASAAHPPLMVAIDGDVGGIGKSTLAVLMAMMFGLLDLPLDVFELDEQSKLARFLGADRVTGLHGAKLEADADGERDLVPIFAPLHRALERMRHSKRSVLLEVGGALTGIWNSFIREVDLEEDLQALGIRLVVFLVLVTGEESARQVVAQVRELRQILPSAEVVIVRNERDGCPRKEAQHLPPDLRKALLQALKSCPNIGMPRLGPKSRRIYDRLGLMPSEIIAWHRDHYREAMARTGERLLESKRVVKDIAAWSADVRKELVGVLPFLGGRDAD